MDRILSTPLVALRKRGFNVDRILNQQREERLRIKAEAAREREERHALEKAPVPTDVDASSDGTSQTAVDTTGSGVSTSSSPNGKRGLFDRLRRSSRDMKDKLPPPKTPTMPGAFDGMGAGMFEGRKGLSDGSVGTATAENPTVGAGNKTGSGWHTKRVRPFLLA
jgi:hypothetical protein